MKTPALNFDNDPIFVLMNFDARSQLFRVVTFYPCPSFSILSLRSLLRRGLQWLNFSREQTSQIAVGLR